MCKCIRLLLILQLNFTTTISETYLTIRNKYERSYLIQFKRLTFEIFVKFVNIFLRHCVEDMNANNYA